MIRSSAIVNAIDGSPLSLSTASNTPCWPFSHARSTNVSPGSQFRVAGSGRIVNSRTMPRHICSDGHTTSLVEPQVGQSNAGVPGRRISAPLHSRQSAIHRPWLARAATVATTVRIRSVTKTTFPGRNHARPYRTGRWCSGRPCRFPTCLGRIRSRSCRIGTAALAGYMPAPIRT